MAADLVFVTTMPALRDYAERCRRLALIARHHAVRQQLLSLAQEMERQAANAERWEAARTDRKAG